MRDIATDTLGGKVFEPSSVRQLVKVLGMLGSEHEGERASAAAIADRMVRHLGLTWNQIIRVTPPIGGVGTTEEKIDFCRNNGADILTAWEWGFITGIHDWPSSLTSKQLGKLDALVAKVKAWRATA